MLETAQPQSDTLTGPKPALAETLANAQSVTVEIGSADTPLFMLDAQAAFDALHLYVGVNVDEVQHEWLRQQLSDKAGYALLADKEHFVLPLADESADLVFYGNVFGEPESPFIMEQFKDRNGRYQGSSNLEDKVRTLQEAKRVLKRDGRIVVLETNTPYGSSFSENGSRAIVEILEAQGLKCELISSPDDPDWGKLASNFAAPHESWNRKSYLVIAAKNASSILGSS